MTMIVITSIHQNISSVKQINTFVVEQLPISQVAPAACFSQVALPQVLISERYGCCIYAISGKIKLQFLFTFTYTGSHFV
jgi:hypothetical protein